LLSVYYPGSVSAGQSSPRSRGWQFPGFGRHFAGAYEVSHRNAITKARFRTGRGRRRFACRSLPRSEFMLARRFTCLAIVALAVAPLPVRAAEDAKAPALVVRIKSLDGLLDDAMYLAELAGAGEQARQGKAMLPILLGEKESERIDPTRPLGLYGTMSEV